MKWSSRKYRLKSEYYKTARKGNYRATIEKMVANNNEYFRFTIERPEHEYSYNSLWYGKVFNTESACMIAAEKYIDQLLLTEK